MTEHTSSQNSSTNDRQTIEYLRRRLRVSEEVDEIIEKCLTEQKCLAATTDCVFTYLSKEMSPNAIFFRTQDEELKVMTFVFGKGVTKLEEEVSELLSVSERQRMTKNGFDWFVMPLDMAGQNIGAFGMSFPADTERSGEETFALMNAVAEEMDNLFYGIQANRFKYMTIMEIQRCLRAKTLAEAIDLAVNIIGDAVPIDDIVLLYLDEDLEGAQSIQYVMYLRGKKVFASLEKPMPALDELIRAGKQIVVPGNRDLAGIIDLDGFTETVLLDGLIVETLVGKILLKPSAGFGFSIASREVIQVFAEALRQRLVDFNREKNALRQYFSPEVTRKLLQEPNYSERYLSARKADIGILFADISGFTRLSEQVLKDPERIASFIDGWSHGAVECLFAEGGALDKLVGDCVIGLFGPPFFQRDGSQTSIALIRAAEGIRRFTTEFFRRPGNADILASPMFPQFGVAIGINFCSADVGMIGPNKDLTAFSSGMNNTARLQGVAHSGEILVTPSVRDLAEMSEPKARRWSEIMNAKVKNVQEPLNYYVLLG
ncbi:MAG: adenylate/guanylate cyclase domain-containing protein [Candidatus Ozemobacteraceae bacterium]